MKRIGFVPAIPIDSSVVPYRFFELQECVTVFDPPLHLRRLYIGSACPGQLSLFGGDSVACNDLSKFSRSSLSRRREL